MSTSKPRRTEANNPRYHLSPWGRLFPAGQAWLCREAERGAGCAPRSGGGGARQALTFVACVTAGRGAGHAPRACPCHGKNTHRAAASLQRNWIWIPLNCKDLICEVRLLFFSKHHFPRSCKRDNVIVDSKISNYL